MPKLQQQPPAWVRNYIDVPFKERGRDLKGADCWGLARLVYAEMGILLPRLDDQYADLSDVGLLAALESREKQSWKPITREELEFGDMMTALLARGCPHVGVVVAENEVLHTIERTNSCRERLDSLRIKPRITGFYRYAGPVCIQGRVDPFRDAPISVELPHGLTITELLAAAGIEPSPHLRVWVNNKECPAEHWAHIRPKPGRQVRVCAVPRGGGGGGKSVLRIVAVIAVIALAIAAPYIAAGLGATMLSAGTVGGALLAAGVGLVGQLLVNALIPPPKPKFGDASGFATSPSIAGTRNSARPWAPVPMIFGEMRVAPPYGARAYTENVGDSQYLRCLFVPSANRIEISDPQIGDTDLGFFEEVEVEYREGLPGDAPLTLYPETIIEDAFSVLLTAGVWQVRTSSTDATHLSIDLTFANGLAHYDESGNRQERSVSFEVEYSPAGANTWTPAIAPFTVTAAQGELLRRNVAWNVPAGQYDIRVRRTTDDATTNRTMDKVYFSALRTFRPSDPILLARCSKVAIRIKASGQLNNIVDQFSIKARSVLPDWDAASGTWIERFTCNPASIYVWILKLRLPESRILLDDFKVWHQECIDNGWEYNGVIDTATVFSEMLDRVASAGRATRAMRDGLHSIVRDRRQSVPRQLLTPRNSKPGFRFSKAFPDLPHALRIRFLDRDSGWQPKERIVLADGYSQLKNGILVDAFDRPAPELPPATIFENMDLDGVTSAEHVFKHGRYFLAVGRLRPEIYTISTDIESLVSSRGDLVLIQHDVAMWGDGSGRIEQLVTDGAGNLRGVTVDESFSMGMQYSYRLRVRLANGELWYRDLERAEGIFRQLNFAHPVPAGELMPEPKDLFAFGQVGKETREVLIKSITWDKDLDAELTLVDYSPAVHDADQGAIPPWDPGTSTGQDYTLRPETPIIEQIVSDETVMYRGADGSLQPRMVITLRIPSSRRPMATHAQVRIRKKAGAGQTPWAWTVLPLIPIEGGNVSVLQIEQGTLYEIRLRTVTPAGLTSLEALAEHYVLGKLLPPPDVTSLNVVRLSDGTRRYSWVFPTSPPDLAGFRLRYGPAGSLWTNMTPLHEGLVQVNPSELNEPDAGTWRFGIKAVDTSGNESLNAAFVEKTLGPPRIEGIAISEDAGLIGWPGTKTDCHIAGDILEADDPTTWDYLSGVGMIWDRYTRWNLSPRSPISYVHTLDAGFVLDFSPDAVVAGDGVLSVEVSSSIDGVTWTDYRDLAIAKAEAITGRYSRTRVTCVSDSVSTVPTITRVLVLMRAAPVVHEINDLDTATLGAQIVSTGEVYLPVPAGMFRQIRSVQISFVAGGGGRSWELVSRDPVLGPRVRLYDSDLQLAHAVIDARISGI